MRRILAVCKGNRARSPMFEHLLRRELSETIYKDVIIESAAGLREADFMAPEEGAVAVLKGIGIDISDHRARWIGRLDLTQYDKIYCMDPAVEPLVRAQLNVSSNSVVVIVNEAEGGIPNPYGKDQAAYDLALQITQREVKKILGEDFFPML